MARPGGRDPWGAGGARDGSRVRRTSAGRQNREREKGTGWGKRDITDIDRFEGSEPRGHARKRLMQAA